MAFDIVAILYPNPGKEARLEEIMVEFTQLVSRTEQKTIRYQPYKQVGEGHGNEFVVIERYTDEPAFEAHVGSNDFAKLGQKLQEEGILAKAPWIIKLQPLSAGFDAR